MNFSSATKYTLLVVSALLLQGCANYEEALNAQKLNLSESLAGVTKNSPHVGGKALAFIPPRHVIKENGVVVIGRGQVPDKTINYVVDSMENDFFGLVEAVKKAEFFDSVVMSRSLSEVPSERPDYVISLETTGTNQWQWYIYRADNAGNKIPLAAEGTKKGAARLNSFNDSLNRALISLGGNVVK